MDDSRRLESMIKKAAENKINRRFYKIDAETCRIVDVIGPPDVTFPKESFINAMPEDLIKNQNDITGCRQAIASVHESGDPMFIKLSITIEDRTTLEHVHFRRGRNGRGDDRNTVIAYTEEQISIWKNGEIHVNNHML